METVPNLQDYREMNEFKERTKIRKSLIRLIYEYESKFGLDKFERDAMGLSRALKEQRKVEKYVIVKNNI